MKRSHLIPLVLVPAIVFAGTLFLSFKPKQEDTNIKGYFTTKNHEESVIITTPKVDSDEVSCPGGCTTKIGFTNSNTASITVKDCIGADITNLGDLNGDGLDEIGILPQWFGGCWHLYRVYTYKHKKWELAVPPIQTHCNEFETPGLKVITKDPEKPGNVLVTYSVFDTDDITFKTISEPIK
ncbi:hypothetical protein [Mucilaginibacter sp. KACC 22063]|uniref:hypothetical protein n=1 Tax=Mucilaginibacter sp. KACC 22063 TaxID=3025666 RepID=UPI0023672DA1|nr:hypothetical protein [Mucilaginibacter sp. KACC 22063]WDF55711.1 hypothetical protein PQ461_01385 [Mucilaginibacter sp. KACC 22063]